MDRVPTAQYAGRVYKARYQTRLTFAAPEDSSHLITMRWMRPSRRGQSISGGVIRTNSTTRCTLRHGPRGPNITGKLLKGEILMAGRLGRTEVDISLRFGGGLHSAASEEDIDARECVAGRNFTLDLENKEFKTRNGCDKIAMAPNAASINGFATLKKSNGDIAFLVQAGTVVYSWDGTSFAQVGTVNRGAKLRGRFSHYSALDDKVLITNLALQEQVAEWDHDIPECNISDEADNPFGNFFAKYCYVAVKRAYFGNVKNSSSTLPHVLVG